MVIWIWLEFQNKQNYALRSVRVIFWILVGLPFFENTCMEIIMPYGSPASNALSSLPGGLLCIARRLTKVEVVPCKGPKWPPPNNLQLFSRSIYYASKPAKFQQRNLLEKSSLALAWSSKSLTFGQIASPPPPALSAQHIRIINLFQIYNRFTIKHVQFTSHQNMF